MIETKMVRGMLTVFISWPHERVYKDDGCICIQIGETQEEALALLAGLSAGVESLPTDATQAIKAAEEAQAEAAVAAAERDAYERLPREEKEKLAAEEAARVAAANEPVYDIDGNLVPK